MNRNIEKGNSVPNQYNSAIEMLEKFKSAKEDPELNETLKALKAGEPTELQIEIALAEIKNLNIRLKSLTHLEYGNAFFRREISNESELASHSHELEEAEKTLYETLIKINPMRRRESTST